jgi:hypothetical protein
MQRRGPVRHRQRPVRDAGRDVVPIGSIGLAFFALGGFVLAAKATGLRPGVVDLAFLMLLALGLPALVYGYQYVAAGPVGAKSFLGFVASAITDTR